MRWRFVSTFITDYNETHTHATCWDSCDSCFSTGVLREWCVMQYAPMIFSLQKTSKNHFKWMDLYHDVCIPADCTLVENVWFHRTQGWRSCVRVLTPRPRARFLCHSKRELHYGLSGAAHLFCNTPQTCDLSWLRNHTQVSPSCSESP